MRPAPNRRSAILAAAKRLFAVQGYEITSMEGIRRVVDISNGSLFHHFPTKECLAAALYLEALGSYQTVVLAALEREKSPRRAVCATVEAHFRWVVGHVEEARCLHEMRRTPSVEAAEKELSALNALMFAKVRAWLDRHVGAGAVRDLPVGVFIAILIGPAMEFTKAWLRDPDPQRMARATPLFAEAAWRAIRAGDPSR
jgi:AcrR family transcriptional regulator